MSLRLAAAERINQEGRLLGPLPVVTQPLLFNTPEADAVVSAMQIFPVTHPWNEDISRRPVLTNSDAMIAQIIGDLASSRRTVRLFKEMNFVLAPDDQPLTPIQFVDYPDESDPGPYPIPWNMPIETWPSETGALTLSQWQADVNNDGGDRHAIIAQPGTGLLWEMWQAKLINTNPAAPLHWRAANGARFDLRSNRLRPLGWTSGDAAGLAMFPALVRYDECQRGRVEHALRLVVKRTRVGPIYPATHQASVGNLTNLNIPAMGQRLRLKAAYNIPAGWTRCERAVLLGLKKYGAIVADNGGFFSLSITPDNRFAPDAFAHISSLGITNFEVVQTTGPGEGPRSAGAPRADAGPDFRSPAGVAAILQGSVAWSGREPAIRWRLYAGPGAALFGDASRASTVVTFSAPGLYQLLLSADDGEHAVSYDMVEARVGLDIVARIARENAASVEVSWTGGTPPYVVASAEALSSPVWIAVATNNTNHITLPVLEAARFFRIMGQ